MRTTQERADIIDGFIRGLLKFTYEERSGAGAISVNVTVSYWTSTGANALTLADGEEGQLKVIIHAVDGGSLVITPANFGGATSATITSTTAGDAIILMFVRGNWWVIGFNSNTAVTGSAVTFA